MADTTHSAGSAAGSAGNLQPTELGFDQILVRLREVVIRLESGELSLEQSLVIYEEGVRLARRGQQLLASAERRVEILLSVSGGVEVAPFHDRGEALGGDQEAGVSAAGATLAPASAPPELLTFLEETRRLIDAELDRRLRPPADDPGRLIEAMHYAATGPGKRLRPALVIAAAEACGATRELALPAAVALEMLHAYTLVHDDLPAMDDDDMRRGRPAVHIAFGEAIAILAGDGLLTAAFGALAEIGPGASAAVAVLARRAGPRELLAGQAIDLTSSPDELGTITALERLHAAKTGALFAAAAELGGITAGAAPHVCADLGRYGMAIGVAFQHADDRDDGEQQALAATAAARMRTMCDEARAIAASLGPRAARLDAIAAWIMARA